MRRSGSRNAGTQGDLPAGEVAGTRSGRVFSRRNLIIGSGVTALAAGGAFGLLAARDQDVDTEPVVTSPLLRAGAMVSAAIDADDMKRWRSDVDTLAQYGQNLVRTGIYAWTVAPERGRWDLSVARFHKQQLEYARQAGLAVNMVLPGAPDWAQSLSWDDYVDACTWFWSHMEETFGAEVALWQPFNEADHSHYRNFTAATRDAAYLGELSQLLGVARRTLGKGGTPVTTNLTGWPMNDEREEEWYVVLDAIGAELDVLSIDLYPADQDQEIARLATRMQRVKQRYKKPVFVAELGLQTTADSWTEPEQKHYVSAAINALRTVELWGICLYELRDTEVQPGFGIKRADGSHKLGFEDVMTALDPR